MSVLPEEGVVLDADFPQSLRGPVVGQLEAYGALKLFVLKVVRDRSEGRGVKGTIVRRDCEAVGRCVCVAKCNVCFLFFNMHFCP